MPEKQLKIKTLRIMKLNRLDPNLSKNDQILNVGIELKDEEE